MKDAQNQNPRWIVRLSPLPDSDMDRLLQMPLGLDVWERQRDPDVLVVAASEAQISELERRRLAKVERLYTVEEFVSEFGPRAEDTRGVQDTEERNTEE